MFFSAAAGFGKFTSSTLNSYMLAWDIDFGSDLELMASTKLDAVVTDNLAALVQQKRELLLTAV